MLKYLKKFNESNGPELSFDDFKDVMSDLTDQFNFECEFKDYSDDADNPFYDFWLFLPTKEGYELHDDIPDMNFSYLNWDNSSILHPTDGPDEVSDDDIEEILGVMDDKISDLTKLKNDVDDVIENNKKGRLVFDILKNKILPRLRNFSNLETCCIGFHDGELRVTFEINESI